MVLEIELERTTMALEQQRDIFKKLADSLASSSDDQQAPKAGAEYFTARAKLFGEAADKLRRGETVSSVFWKQETHVKQLRMKWEEVRENAKDTPQK